MLLNLLKQLLYAFGTLGIYHRWRNRNVLTVVMYHRVMSPKDPRWNSCDPDYTISDELFAKTIRFLKYHYNVVSVDDVIAARNGTGALPSRPLLITFDDGWSDNVEYAVPILQSESVPALIFVVADAIDRRRPFFQEELIAAWRTGRLSSEDVKAMSITLGGTKSSLSVGDLSAMRDLIAGLEALTSVERSRILSAYTEKLDDGLRHMVSTQELGLLREGAIAIGLHGKTHTPLTRADDIGAELEGARHAVAHQLKLSPNQLVTMSFPHGQWNLELMQLARKSGYELMFTSLPVLNNLDPCSSDAFGRVGIETDGVQDHQGRFRPDWLALQLFRRQIVRIN